jgi:hypothetical protein
VELHHACAGRGPDLTATGLGHIYASNAIALVARRLGEKCILRMSAFDIPASHECLLKEVRNDGSRVVSGRWPSPPSVDEPVEIHIANLYSNMQPIATSVATDKMSWSGTNLTDVFDSVEVGKGGTKHPISCSSNVACQVDAKKPYGKDENGYLYLVGRSMEIPLMSVSGSGTPAPVYYSAPVAVQEKKGKSGGTQPQVASQSSPPQPAGAQIQNLQNFQQSTSVVGKPAIGKIADTD